MDSQNGLDLRKALLTSSLGAVLGQPNNSSPAQDALNLSDTKTVPTPHDLLAIAQAQSFPTELDDPFDSNILTLLPNALADSDVEEEEQDEQDDAFLANEFLNAQALEEGTDSMSQFSVFKDAVVVDGADGMQLLARDEATRAYEQRMEAEQQGREVARIIKSRELTAAAEHAEMLARHSLAVVTPGERFAAYKAAMARPAGDPVDAPVSKRHRAEVPQVHREEPLAEAGAVEAVEEGGGAGYAARFMGRYALPPESGEYVAARTATGRTLFFPLRTPAAPTVDGAESAGRMGMAQANRVVGEIEQELSTRESLRATQKLSSLSLQQHQQQAARDTRLWAEKYRARTYVDLVSAEGTNRAVLQWLKEWDHCVFHRGAGGDTSDRWKRPHRRVLLLSGPPGLGKTTLAHVVARQAGYDVVEINASDERTAAKVRDRVLGVTQTRAVGGKRPQLLVIDEIDGASAAVSAQGDFISMLVRLATASDNGDSTAAAADRTKDGESGGGGKNKKKKRKAPMQLLRPIICICNNVYAPVLRPLRQIAQSYHVHGPTATRLAQRLQEVCVREQLACDAWVLGDLARQTACDVRASLNALQLLANRTASGSKLDSASLAGAGGKDVQRSLFALWAQIFTRADAPGQPRQSPAECARAVAEAVRASGEHERLLQGCWENYLTMDLRDVTHTRVSRLLTEWLCFADTLDSASRRNPQADALHAYQEYPLVAVHLACASPLGLARTQFAYPAADYAAHQALGARTALAHTLVQGCVAPRLRASLASSSRVCGEFADYFLHVLSPTEVSTGNRHLLRGRELECAMRLVHVMEAWRLRWVQTKDAEGRFVYRLEPPVDQLVRFVGRKPAVPFLPMPYAVRQMLAQEMDRRRAQKDEPHAVGDGNGIGDGGRTAAEAEAAKREYLGRLFADPLAAAAAKRSDDPAAQTPPVVTRDFFGRVVTKKPGHQLQSSMVTADRSKKTAKAWFHYFEGFTNAVRKPTKISELL